VWGKRICASVMCVYQQCCNRLSQVIHKHTGEACAKGGRRSTVCGQANVRIVQIVPPALSVHFEKSFLRDSHKQLLTIRFNRDRFSNVKGDVNARYEHPFVENSTTRERTKNRGCAWQTCPCVNDRSSHHNHTQPNSPFHSIGFVPTIHATPARPRSL
jgi:hypothetical protein